MPDTEEPGKREKTKREFMRETIVKPPLSKRQLVKRLCLFVCLSVLFGALAAVSFVLSKPLADRYLGAEEPSESPTILFTKDEPETTAAPAETEAPEPSEEETFEAELLEDAVEKVMAGYSFSQQNLDSLSSVLRDIGMQSDKGIVTVSPGKQQTDLFGNPVENTTSYAGAVIAQTSGEYLIFTYADAVRQADYISVLFYNGTEAAGEVRQIDGVNGMAVLAVKAASMDSETRSEVKVLNLGNSYSVRIGDMVLGVGAPSGMVHSLTYWIVSYVARDVQVPDGITRVLYTDIRSNSGAGTFLVNTAGEIVGWTTAQYGTEDGGGLTAAVSISDYKTVLEKMTNNSPAPYFGIRGQEISEAMGETGIPRGVYVTEALAGSPAYDAGIQNGDIIVLFGEKEILTFKELQTQIETCQCGTAVAVKVMRRGREGYTELEYKVDIRAR